MALFTDGYQFECENAEEAIQHMIVEAHDARCERVLWVCDDEGEHIRVATVFSTGQVDLTWEGSKHVSVFEVRE